MTDELRIEDIAIFEGFDEDKKEKDKTDKEFNVKDVAVFEGFDEA